MKSSHRNFLIAIFLTLIIVPAFANAADYVTCESDKGRRRYCPVHNAYDADIRLSHELSDSPCIEGSSWGIDDRGIWVDDGCRAEFRVSYSRGYNDYDNRREPEREHCPSGFEPGNHRCSNEERRRGCKDMRMPGGTTCNSRGWGYR